MEAKFCGHKCMLWAPTLLLPPITVVYSQGYTFTNMLTEEEKPESQYLYLLSIELQLPFWIGTETRYVFFRKWPTLFKERFISWTLLYSQFSWFLKLDTFLWGMLFDWLYHTHLGHFFVTGLLNTC